MDARGQIKRAPPLYIPALLIAASSVSILSTDLYTPSLPHLQDVFGVDAAAVQLTMSLNLAGFAVAQLVYGPLSDRVGRRPVLILGMVGFALASLACALAPDLESLVAARVLQGITACTEVVVGYAVVRELYDDAGAVKVLAAYGMAIALAPAVGPIVGGQMHVWFGWRSNFFLLTALIVVVTILLWRFLPETLVAPDRKATRPSRVLSDYRALLRNGRFMVYILACSFMMAALFAFITEAPFVLIESMDVATESYGYYYAAVVVAYFLGSLVANRAAGHLSPDRLLLYGLLLGAAGPLAMLVAALAGSATALGLAAFVSVFAFGLGLVFATAPVRAFDMSRSGRGLAAAFLGAAEIGLGAVGAFAVGLLHDGSALPLAAIMAGSTLLPLVAYIVVRPWRFEGPIR